MKTFEELKQWVEELREVGAGYSNVRMVEDIFTRLEAAREALEGHAAVLRECGDDWYKTTATAKALALINGGGE